MQLLIYILLGAASFLFVVVPVSGSAVLNPLLALLTDPHTAVSIAVFFFMMNGFVKFFVFMKDIRIEYVKKILPLSLAMAPLGALFIGYIPANILLIIIFLFTLYFLFKKLYELGSKRQLLKKAGRLEILLMSLISGFMQGAGFGTGGVMRKTFLLSENLSISEMNGTTSAIGVWILAVSVLTRLITDQVSFAVLVPILYLIPIIILANWLGRRFLKILDKKVVNLIIVGVLIFASVSLAFKIF